MSAFAVIVPKAPLPSTIFTLSCTQLHQEFELLQHTGKVLHEHTPHVVCAHWHVLPSMNAVLHTGQGASKLSSACCGCCRG